MIKLKIKFFDKNHNVKAEAIVEFAYTSALRRKGLSNKLFLRENEGMFFNKAGIFWMKNVFFPLDLIFIDYNGKIVDIQFMDVEFNKIDQNNFVEYKLYKSKDKTAEYAVEMPANWCKRNNIKVGDYIKIERVLL